MIIEVNMKCPNCSITVLEMPEDSDYEEYLCNSCYNTFEEYFEEWCRDD